MNITIKIRKIKRKSIQPFCTIITEKLQDFQKRIYAQLDNIMKIRPKSQARISRTTQIQEFIASPCYQKPICFPVKSSDKPQTTKIKSQMAILQKSIKQILQKKRPGLQTSIYRNKQPLKYTNNFVSKHKKQINSSLQISSLQPGSNLNISQSDQQENISRPMSKTNFRQKTQEKHKQKLSLIFSNLAIANCSQNLMVTSKKFVTCRGTSKNHSEQIQFYPSKAQNKLKKYKQSLNYLRNLHKITPVFLNANQRFKIYIGSGNNASLIKQTISKRWWWQITENKQAAHFIWTQLRDKEYFILNYNKVGLHNHFVNNQYLGNKKTMFYLMRDYYTSKNEQVFNYLPHTFHIVNLNDHQWPKFVKYYHQRQSQRTKNTKHITFANIPSQLWIIKPGQDSNRGKGIQICSNISQIQTIISQLKKKQSYIVQQYLMKPLLYHKRKFDIRCYMLLVKIGTSLKGYWCKQGYIRTSSCVFDLSNCCNSFIHLTNDAIQANPKNFGEFQQGNKLSFGNFQTYLNANFSMKYNFIDKLLPQLRQMALHVMQASASCIGVENSAPVFQLFGLDFMIDQNFKPWLIEVNTNPCLETSCSILYSIIPKIIQDCFKLSVDVLFSSSQNYQNVKTHLIPDTQHTFELIFDGNNVKKRQQIFQHA